MNYTNAILDNYELLEQESLDAESIDKLIKDWRLKCQNTPSPVLVEKPRKSTPLRLVKD